MSIVAEAPDFLQVFSDGTVKRFSPPIISASSESENGYKSKDITLDPSKPISARIFLPDTPDSTSLLPILVYFHGGGFCIGSTTWCGYHYFLGDFSVRSQSIVVSIDYRLAPENKLPIAYEDCFSSLDWLSREVHTEPWLKQGDLSRVFLSGDSAGGNIAHNVALLALKNKVKEPKIQGILPIHPYFGSEERTEKEKSYGAEDEVKMNDMFWKLSLPEGATRDHPACNFEVGVGAGAEDWKEFPPVVVYVAGLDFLKERGVMYAEFLKKKEVEVMLVEEENESHVYHVFHPESEATRVLQSQMTDFMNRF